MGSSFGSGRGGRGEAVDGGAERAGLQQGGGGGLDHAAEQPAAGADGDGGGQVAATLRGARLGGAAEGDGALRGQRQAPLGGLGNVQSKPTRLPASEPETR